MTSKPGIFDPVKQPGNTTTYNNSGSKPPQYISNERSTSPFRGYKNDSKSEIRYSQGTSAVPIRNPGQSTYDITSSQRTNQTSTDINAMISQQFQEIMQQEFQNMIIQWREEIFDEVKQSLIEFNTKSHRNKETMDMIKQHLKSNTQSIDEVDEKLSDYDLKLENIGVLIKQELQTIRTNILNRKPDDDSQKYPENVSLPALKQDIMEELRENIEEFNKAQTNENTGKFQQLQIELSEVLQGKLTKVVDHLNNKISIIEKQIKSLENVEDPEIEKVKYEIESKLQESSQSLKEQMYSLKKLIETAANEPYNSNYDSQELGNSGKIDSILAEVSKAEYNLREIQRYYEKKIHEFEEKWHEQFAKIESELRSCSEEVKGLQIYRSDVNKFDGNANNLSKISNLSREVEGLINSQKTIQSELHKLDQSIDEIKYIKAESIGNSQKKLFGDVSIDPRIKRLEEQIESLAKLVDGAKLYNSNLGGSIGSESTPSTFDRYKIDSLPQTQSSKLSNQNYPFNRNLSPLRDDVLHHTTDVPNSKYNDPINRPQYQSWSTSSHPNVVNSAKTDKYGIESRLDDPTSYDKPNTYSNNPILGGTYEPYYALNKKTNNPFTDAGTFQSKDLGTFPERFGEHHSIAGSKQSYLSASPQHDDKGYMIQDRKHDSGNISSERILDPIKGDRRYGNQAYHEKPDHSTQHSQGNYNMPRPNEKSPTRLESPRLGNIRALSPVTGHNTHKINNIDDLPRHTEEEEEIVYQLDENGFLMDEDGNYILDEQGQMIKLNEEHIERLRANNLLEEEN